MKKISILGLGLTFAIVAAICMLLISIASSLGFYQGAVTAMQGWHMFYTPGVMGTITGMIEAAVISFLVGALIAWFYNILTK